MKKRFFAFFLALFLVFSAASTDYIEAYANGADLAASLVVSGVEGGIAIAVSPELAVVAILAALGITFVAYSSSPEMQARVHNTVNHLRRTLPKYFDKEGNIVGWQFNGVTRMAQEVIEEVRDYWSEQWDAWTVSSSPSDFDVGHGYKGVPEKVDGKYQYAGSVSGSARVSGSDVGFITASIDSYYSSRAIAAYIYTNSSGYPVFASYNWGYTGGGTSEWVFKYEGDSSGGASSFVFPSGFSVSDDWNIPIFRSLSEAESYCKAIYNGKTYDDSAALNKASADTTINNDGLAVDERVANPDAADEFEDIYEKWLEDQVALDIDGVVNYPNTIADEDTIAGDVIDTLPVTLPGTIDDVWDPTMDDAQSGATDDDVVDDAADVAEDVVISRDNDEVIEDTDSVIEDIVDWGFSYISPSTGILSKFPFSIPYDFYLIISALSGGGGDPRSMNPASVSVANDLDAPGSSYVAYGSSALDWDLDFAIPILGNPVNVPIDLDLKQFEWLFRIIRTGVGILWLLSLLHWFRGGEEK